MQKAKQERSIAMKQIYHFVLTGGPCAGKTTAIGKIEMELLERGYTVLIVPETATELISNGIKPFEEYLKIMDFQRIVLEKQLNKENLYRKVAGMLKQQKIVIIYDRGIMDNKSYITEDQFKTLLKEYHLNEMEARERYDAVFHLVTAADGAEEFYTLENNAARSESVEEARELDKKTLANWIGHPHLRVIDNSTDLEMKLNRLMSEIYAAIGDPIPVEIERKYLIEMPNMEEIARITPITTIDIVQNYLISEQEGVERRIRQRGIDGKYLYYLTEKKKINMVKRLERGRRISQNDYLYLLTKVDTSLKQIMKKRICFVYERQYFELDVYEFSKDKAILEIELTEENEEVKIPDFIHIIKEVTDDKRYKNYELARSYEL